VTGLRGTWEGPASWSWLSWSCCWYRAAAKAAVACWLVPAECSKNPRALTEPVQDWDVSNENLTGYFILCKNTLKGCYFLIIFLTFFNIVM